MDNLKKVIEGICVGKEDSAAGSLKVQLHIINNSNPCRAQFSYDELESLREFCEEHDVREIKFIEPMKDVTYIIVVYRDHSLEGD